MSTTAENLGKFRRELIENGIPAEAADDIVLMAARCSIENDGWSVKA